MVRELPIWWQIMWKHNDEKYVIYGGKEIKNGQKFGGMDFLYYLCTRIFENECQFGIGKAASGSTLWKVG